MISISVIGQDENTVHKSISCTIMTVSSRYDRYSHSGECLLQFYFYHSTSTIYQM